MWRLSKSRGQFAKESGLNPDRTIWAYVGEKVLDQVGAEQVPDYLLEEIQRRVPVNLETERSNCPIVSALAEHLIASCDPTWKGLARNVYFGVTLHGEPGAESFNRVNAGVVQMSVQYVWLLEAYVMAFDEYAYGLRKELENADGTIPVSSAGGFGAWAGLERMVRHWRDDSILYLGERDLLLKGTPGRTAQDIDGAVNHAQEWTMAHELAHHLLGHTVRNPRDRAREARIVLDKALPDVARIFIASYPPHHQDELHCDALAFLLIFGYFTHPGGTHTSAYAAMFGAAISLVSLSHCGDHWVAGERSESHPAMRDRWQSLIILSEQLFGNWTRDEQGGHPLDLLNQLRVFMDVAFTYWVDMTTTRWLDEPSNRELHDAMLLGYYFAAWQERVEGQLPAPNCDRP